MTLAELSFAVDYDKDCVISFKVRGDSVSCTVNYVNADGDVLPAKGFRIKAVPMIQEVTVSCAAALRTVWNLIGSRQSDESE